MNGPLQLYPYDYTVPASSTLLSVLSTAIPDAAKQHLLQQIVQHVTDLALGVSDLAYGARFMSEMTMHGLTLLEAHCICAYTCDARAHSNHEYSYTREDSPFFMCMLRYLRLISRHDSLLFICRYNKALREGDPEAIARWRDFSLLFDSGLSKLPAVNCTVYRLMLFLCAAANLTLFCTGSDSLTAALRGLDCPLTEVSHLYVVNGIVWYNSVTSTTTDKNSTLASFGEGASGKAGTFIEMRVHSARSVCSFSSYPKEAELLLRPNTCAKVLVALSSSQAALLQGLAQLPPNVDLVVLQVDG